MVYCFSVVDIPALVISMASSSHQCQKKSKKVVQHFHVVYVES